MTPDSLKFEISVHGTVLLNGLDAEAAKDALIAHLEWQMNSITFSVDALALHERSEIISVEEHDRVAAMDDDEAVATCEQARVRLSQAQESEVAGRWDWLDDNGNASECSFESEGDAARDAIRKLRLLDEPGFDVSTLHTDEA